MSTTAVITSNLVIATELSQTAHNFSYTYSSIDTLVMLLLVVMGMINRQSVVPRETKDRVVDREL